MSQYYESATVWRDPWGCGYPRLYRAYTNYLNRKRPRGRKLKWKMLNRSQREAAEKWAELMYKVEVI